MDSGYWQLQFEDWLRHHHQQDAAHDIYHFRRV
ncbi:metal-dependent phospho hydrolase [Salmonella enterica subsp. arizonae]|nr:metal-dependent phospho hydrolase [Salmonella enterica subsp. arizonae]SUG29899.1 metal-dependent phospho hydrolase [Salmonella enterica subsp. arizonae]SUG42238.1 metal-dependent phospho hydrolase [Salmonella enterica subsp. arizonae]SUG47208.1 metal-dependent phospho hydrolase [Salmonella enterica subsp. arizonae]